MKLAAIDIGSNAVRLQISHVICTDPKPQFKTLEYIRFPLALGQEVFKNQYISDQDAQALRKLLQAFKLLIELYQVDAYEICATSAWREAKNKLAIKANLEAALGICINLINGKQEAALVNKAIQASIKAAQYFHIDVGGGSTELSFYKQQKRIATCSFQLGSLRDNLSATAQANWAAMKAWISTHKQPYKQELIGIATGSNIKKLAQLAKRNGKKELSLKRLIATEQHLAGYSLEERIEKLQLNTDRAALILPAAQIYLTALHWAGIKHVLVPDLGLKDGIIQTLYEKQLSGN